ncbi:MAG: tetratricopeptide repeat protein [Burkholderiales bacterium]|nr:tetratricopeptide repeat protein [Burkholderiales bacterium]
MSGDADFLAAARGRLQALKTRHEAGELDAATYDKDRRAVEQEIGDRLLAQPPATAPSAAVSVAKARPSIRLVAGTTIFVAVLAVAGYLFTGSPALIAGRSAAEPERSAAAGPQGAASDAASPGLQQIAAMVDKLAARMKERPDDAEGWVMLARSYTVLGRFAEALPAYARATELLPGNASLLADYADTVAATKRTANNPESIALIERALKIEPTHPKALALAGTADYDRGDYAGAIRRWQAILDRVPAESELGQQVAASIAEARGKLGGAAASAPPATTTANATAGAAPFAAASAAAGVSGTVTLAPALAAQAGPGDTVFVFARAAGGGRMPLAVQKATVADLPLRFRLDDSMAMAPGMTISSAKQVVVSARVSKSGQATPSAGDLSGESAPVAPGATAIAVRIDRVVGTP